jgi:hypothetical protein
VSSHRQDAWNPTHEGDQGGHQLTEPHRPGESRCRPLTSYESPRLLIACPQACDRCRSKKIRCDGIRPCCSQCANVGFECRTSDKLSRRAFPRGYTESLEERVRVLEAEVRELKDLLDEKDEKIDMLSKMHSHHHRRRPSTGSAASPLTTGSGETRRDPTPAKEDTFRVQASPLLLGVENSDSYFMGPSSGRSFIGDSLLRAHLACLR